MVRFFPLIYPQVQKKTLFGRLQRVAALTGMSCISTPVEGKANKAIIELISITLSVPRSAVSIVAGAGSSQKKILVQGRSKDEIAALLEQFID